MKQNHFSYILLIIIAALIFQSCKKDDTSFYEYSDPAFNAYPLSGQPEKINGVCTSHDVMMDSVFVTSPLNIKSKMYLHGQAFTQGQHFLIGDTFIPHDGTWQFIFYGRKTINGLSFSVFIEREF